MEEVFKLPQLIQHYLHHKAAAGPGFTFSEFLSLHYGAESGHRKEASHSNLPMFQHQMGGFIFVLPAVPSLIRWLVVELPATRHQSLYRFSYSLLFKSTLLQPPKGL